MIKPQKLVFVELQKLLVMKRGNVGIDWKSEIKAPGNEVGRSKVGWIPKMLNVA